MAFEFHYCVSLSVVHPTVDPGVISQAIPALRPKIVTRAGDIRMRGPERKAVCSHWLADLHDKHRIDSASKPISEFIAERLVELSPHRELFANLRKEGSVSLLIGWFSESNHSAGVIQAETMRQCGELGLDIELNFYGP